MTKKIHTALEVLKITREQMRPNAKISEYDLPVILKAMHTFADQQQQVKVEPEVKLNFAEKDLANEVKEDIENRIIKGVATYGERLKPFNGRIALQDAYEEILDLALYIKQELKERESKISA